jgi:hypothetical protein
MRRHGRQTFVIAAFAVTFYASVGRGFSVFFRYILPLVPLVCLSAAVAVRQAASWVASRFGVSDRAATLVLAAAVGAAGLINSVWSDVLLARTDARVLAADWLIPRLQGGETLHEAGGMYAQLDLSRARFHRWPFDPATKSFGDPAGRQPDWLVLHESPLWTYAVVDPELRRIAREKYDLAFVVRATKGAGDAARPADYDLQDAFFFPVSGFEHVERPGPTVLIYHRRDAS